MKIVLFGAPGCGKGSQAKLINKEFGWPQISTGDLLRSHISQGTELGKIAKGYIDKGQLVPDNLVIELVKNRIAQEDCKKGYILDGFPRTHEQAVQLDEIDKIDVVIHIDISINEVEKRALNRRICPSCGKIYNMAVRRVDKCDFCGSKLIQRDDDKLEVIRNRIQTYLDQSEPLLKYYKNKKILKDVLSGNSPEETYIKVKELISSLMKNKK